MRTPLGPIAMGGCRGLNLLLGMSTAAVAWHAPHYVIAGGMAIYIAGVTLCARTEAVQSKRLPLAAGVVIMAAGLLLALVGGHHVGAVAITSAASLFGNDDLAD